MSETALMSLSKIRLRHMIEEGVPGAKRVEKLTEAPNKLFGAILIGNNIVNIGASSLATILAANTFGSSRVGIATGLMTILILIFGEITPKSIAKQKSEVVSLKVVIFVDYAVFIFKPLIYVFTAISSVFIRLVGCIPNEAKSFITEEELKIMVGVSEEEGVLEFEGNVRLHYISELIGVYMDSEEFDSIGGLMIGELGRMPEENEEVLIYNLKFVAEEIEKNRAKKVRMFIYEVNAPENNQLEN